MIDFSWSFAAIIGILTMVVGILVKVYGFPDQIIKLRKRKSAEGFSKPMWILSFAAYLLWTIHGILQDDWVLIIGQGFGIITTGIIVFQIFHYKKDKK